MNIRLPGACALVASLLPVLPAQSAKLADEIAYIRGLISELQFVDLAQHEVDILKKTYTDTGDFKLVTQLAIEISLQGAKRHRDRNARRALYKQALEESAAFIERYSADAVALDARVTLTLSCIEFGSFLNEELEIARTETPAKVAELEEEAAAVFRQGVEATNKCEAAFNASDKQMDGFVAWMRRGMLLREHARAVKKDRTFLTGESADTFEELILEVGEETILGQKALFEMSKIEEVRGDLDAAISSYKDAIEAIYEVLDGPDSANLHESAQRLMFEMMQEVYDRLATVSLKQGKTTEVLELVKQFEERVDHFQTVAHPIFGDSLILSRAAVMAGATKKSDVSDALKTAKRINKRHSNDFVGLKAKRLIRDILQHSSDLVTGDLLLEVAKGDYQAKAWDAAIAGFKRSINGMDAETRGRLGFDTWELIGRSNEFMERNLEAAMAYSRALADYGDAMNTAPDKDTKDKLARTSKKAQRCITRVIADSGRDAVFTTLRTRIDQQLSQFNPDEATKGDYSQGHLARQNGKYADAARLFFKVNESYPKYELAQGHGILSLFKLGKFDEVKVRAAAYRTYVKTHDIPEEERLRRGYRPQALAWVHYTEGRILYETARGKDGRRPDLTKFKDVERHFLTFEAQHAASAQRQMAKVHEMLGHAYLEMGEDAKAIERYSKLKALGETSPDAHKALGILMFNSYSGQVKALETELAGLQSVDEKKAAFQKLKAMRQKAVNMGLDYAKTVGKPQYSILYNSMRHAQRLESWPQCEWAAEKILKLYGKSNQTSLRQIRPLLGYALLRQPGRLQSAIDVLNEAQKLLAKGKRTSAYYDVLRYQALALGGWPAFDGLNYQANPGMGKPEKAYEIYWGDDYRKFALAKRRTPEYSLGWYQFQLEAYFFCRQAQHLDSKFAARATTFYGKARSTDDFATLRSFGPEGERIYNLFQQITR